MDVETLKKMNRNKNLIKKYYAFLASVAIIKQIPCHLGPGSTIQASALFCHMLVTCVLA
jgi:hypothetical protein